MSDPAPQRLCCHEGYSWWTAGCCLRTIFARHQKDVLADHIILSTTSTPAHPRAVLSRCKSPSVLVATLVALRLTLFVSIPFSKHDYGICELLAAGVSPLLAMSTTPGRRLRRSFRMSLAAFPSYYTAQKAPASFMPGSVHHTTAAFISEASPDGSRNQATLCASEDITQ